MKFVEGVALSIAKSEVRNTPVAIFLDAAHWLVPTRDGCSLKAAILAPATMTGAGMFHRQHFRIRVQFLNLHGKGMNGITKQAAPAAGIFEDMRNLGALDVEVLEFGASFTSANLLEPASVGLADFHLWAFGEVRLEGVGATVHCLGHVEGEEMRCNAVIECGLTVHLQAHLLLFIRGSFQVCSTSAFELAVKRPSFEGPTHERATVFQFNSYFLAQDNDFGSIAS
jgi:hypothetical protein